MSYVHLESVNIHAQFTFPGVNEEHVIEREPIFHGDINHELD